jgi:hypothetical protein
MIIPVMPDTMHLNVCTPNIIHQLGSSGLAEKRLVLPFVATQKYQQF